MATQNSSNNRFTNNADGFDIAAGVSVRKLTFGGGDVTITGGGTAVITFPVVTSTLATLSLSEALTNKTINGWTLTAATITLTGTTGQTYTFPTSSATLARTDAANTFTGIQTMTSPATTTSITTGSTSFTAWAGATTLLTIGGTGASASMHMPSTLDTSSSITGAIRTSGGISAAKGLYVGTFANIGTSLTMSGGPILEKVVSIADGAGAVINASLGNIFTWTATADRTAGTTTNPSVGQKIIIAFTASGGARTLTLPTATTGDFAFGGDITNLSQTVSGKTDIIGCTYGIGVANRWNVVAYTKGF